jgi:hypothetical protein
MNGIIYDPIKQLDLARKYLRVVIDKLPNRFISFEKWMRRNYPQYVPGTDKFYRSIATHCYYCGIKDEELTIDHFYPQSGNENSIYKEVRVICCKRCNCFKANIDPAIWIQRMIRRSINGTRYRNYSQKEIAKIAERVNKIQNEVSLGINPRVYYQRWNNHKVPKGFLKAA